MKLIRRLKEKEEKDMLEFFVKKFDLWDEVIETFRRIEDEEKEHIRDFYQRNGGTEWIGM